MVMEECIIRDCMRKLGLWYTRTFNPFMTHDELEPIMAILGFVGLPPSNAWKEYAYLSKSFTVDQSPSPPRPRLPYPRVDGLHIYTYQAFIDAVDFYLNKSDISDLFHIRGMPLHHIHDKNRKWRRMEDDNSVFVYREGTLNQTTFNFYRLDKPSNNGCKPTVIRDKGNNNPISCIVPLKDIIVSSSQFI